MPTSMQDIADRVGTSKMTVSRALRDEPTVAPQTRKAILAAADRLGYTPRFVVKHVPAPKSGITYAIVHSQTSLNLELLYHCLAGVAGAARAQGHSLSLCFIDPAQTKAQVLRQLFDRAHPAGIIFNPYIPGDPRLGFDIQALVTEIRRRTHLVMIATPGECRSIACHRVYKNDLKGACKAVNHLIARGHRRIAFVRPPPGGYIGFELRQQAYRQALASHALDYRLELTQAGHDAAGYRATARALIQARPRPTAVVATNDGLAIEIMKALKDRGVNIPRDMAVVGYDNIAAAQTATPPLTTVDTRVDEVGRRAVEWVCELIRRGPKDEPAFREIEVVPALIVRTSCGARRRRTR